MIDFNHFVVKPLLELVQPVYEDFSAPFYALHQDLYIPAVTAFTGKNYQTTASMQYAEAKENYEKLLQSITRIGVTMGVFFAYQKAWHTGNHYLGIIGGLTGCIICFSILNAFDPKTNDMGRSAWFLYKGTVSLLRTFGESRAALLCLVFVRQKKYDEQAGLLRIPAVKNFIHSSAERLADWSHGKPAETPPPIASQPPEHSEEGDK